MSIGAIYGSLFVLLLLVDLIYALCKAEAF